MKKPTTRAGKAAPKPRTRSARPAAAPASMATDLDPPSTQPAANPHRGEHELTLAGVTYRLRPTREAIIACEKRAGGSLIELVRAGHAGALTQPQLAVIAHELIRAGADDDVTRLISAERIGELIYEEGVGHPTARLTTCLTDAANGGRTTAGNVRAAAG